MKIFISYSHKDAPGHLGQIGLTAGLRVHKFDTFLAVGGTNAMVASSVAKLLRRADFATRLFVQSDGTDERRRRLALKAFGQSASCALIFGPGGGSPLADEGLRTAIRERFLLTRGAFRPIPVVCGASARADWMAYLRDALPGVTARQPVLFDESFDEQESLRRLILGIRGLDSEPREEWERGLLRQIVRRRAKNALNVAWRLLVSEVRPPARVKHDGTLALDFGTSASMAVFQPEVVPPRRHARGWAELPFSTDGPVFKPAAAWGGEWIHYEAGAINAGRLWGANRGGLWPFGESKNSLRRYAARLLLQIGWVGAAPRRPTFDVDADGLLVYTDPFSPDISDVTAASRATCVPDVPLSLRYIQDTSVAGVLGLKHDYHTCRRAQMCRADEINHLLPEPLPEARPFMYMARDDIITFAMHYLRSAPFSGRESCSPRVDAAGGPVFNPADFRVLGRPDGPDPRGGLVLLLIPLSDARGRERLFKEFAPRRFGDYWPEDWLSVAPSSRLCEVDRFGGEGLGALGKSLCFVILPTGDADWRDIGETDVRRLGRLATGFRRIVIFFRQGWASAGAEEKHRLWTPGGARGEERAANRAPDDFGESAAGGVWTRQAPGGDLFTPPPRPPA